LPNTRGKRSQSVDVSAGASLVAESAVDVEQLQRATDQARHLIAQSGRYALIDTGTTDAPAAKTHAPRDCDGCKAAIAAKLGAEQSLLGIVTRISRTGYNVTYKLRDASTGALRRRRADRYACRRQRFLAARRGLAHQKQTIGEIALPSDKLGWGFSLRPLLQYQRWSTL
jgi:hypothetical protein